MTYFFVAWISSFGLPVITNSYMDTEKEVCDWITSKTFISSESPQVFRFKNGSLSKVRCPPPPEKKECDCSEIKKRLDKLSEGL